MQSNCGLSIYIRVFGSEQHLRLLVSAIRLQYSEMDRVMTWKENAQNNANWMNCLISQSEWAAAGKNIAAAEALHSKLCGKFSCAILIVLHQLFLLHTMTSTTGLTAACTNEKQTPVEYRIDKWKSSVVGYTGPWVSAQNGDLFPTVSNIKTDMQQYGNIGTGPTVFYSLEPRLQRQEVSETR